MSRIKLLSNKCIDDFTPKEYRDYIRSLKQEKVKTSTKRPYIAKRTKTGKLSLQVRRDPKWLSEEEMNLISKETGIPLSEVFLKMKKMGCIISTEKREKERQKHLEEPIPW